MTAVRDLTDPESLEGNYAGPITRLLASIADGFIALSMYGVILTVITVVWDWLVGSQLEPPTESSVPYVIGLFIWGVLYNGVCWSVWWKTPGKALLGLRVVLRNGADLQARPAWLRALTFPLSFLVPPLGLGGIVLGRERRALHDVLAGTAVVYDWNARTAQWRLLARRGATHQERAH